MMASAEPEALALKQCGGLLLGYCTVIGIVYASRALRLGLSTWLSTYSTLY